MCLVYCTCQLGIHGLIFFYSVKTKILNGYSEAVNYRRTNNAITKRQTINLLNITHTKAGGTRSPLKYQWSHPTLRVHVLQIVFH